MKISRFSKIFNLIMGGLLALVASLCFFNHVPSVHAEGEVIEVPDAPTAPTDYNAYYYYCDYVDNPTYTVNGVSRTFNGRFLTNIRTTQYENHIGNRTFNLSIPAEYGGVAVVGIAPNFTGLHFCDHYWGSSDHWVNTYFDHLKLPASIKYIMNNAFQSTSWGGATANTKYDLSACTNLEIIGDNAFEGCTGLANADLSENTTISKIGNEAFKGCSSIENIVIPSSVTTLGYSAFENCSLLMVVEARCSQLSERLFYNCSSLTTLSLANSITIIPDYAFYSCASLSRVSLNETTTSIGNYAFYSTNLVELTLPRDCTSVGDYAYAKCSGISTLNLRNVEHIGEGAFKNLIKLQTLTIPSTVDEIGADAFMNETSLTTVVFNSDVVSAGMFDGDGALTSVTFSDPANITIVPARMFKNCSNLSTLSVIDGDLSTLEEIGAYAFYNTAFETISLTKNQNTIGEYAFAESKVVHATINVQNISSHMFFNCEDLEDVVINQNVNNSTTQGKV